AAARVPAQQSPAGELGIVMVVLGTHGRDKVTLITSPAIHTLGAWLEQLIAESTGKEGQGLVPVDREPLGAPGAYGADRLFVYVRLASAPDPRQDEHVTALEAAGQPGARTEIG